MPFRDDIDFCCLALNGPRLDVRGTTNLLPEFSVTDSTAHIELDFWAEWLGSLQTQTFRESSLVITAEHYDRYDSGASYQTRERIERRVRLFHFALVLLGCGYNSSALMVGGNTAHGHQQHLGPVQFGLTPCRHPRYRRPKRITADDLQRAVAILVSLEHVYDRVPTPDYRRIRKGFNSWIRGVETDDAAQGLHSFVRATEAIIRPTSARKLRRPKKKSFWRPITPTFLERGQTLIGRSTRSKRLLKQLYELRSCIEHTKNIEPAIRRPKDVSRDEAFVFRTLQAEMLASAIYTRIFTNDALREQLRTEVAVEGFWRRSEHKRLALWGKPIDLHAAAHAEFLSSHIDAMDLI